jgi:hypothetical protein
MTLTAAQTRMIESSARRAMFAEVNRQARLFLIEPGRLRRLVRDADFLPLEDILLSLRRRRARHRSGEMAELFTPVSTHAALIAVRLMLKNRNRHARGLQ